MKKKKAMKKSKRVVSLTLLLLVAALALNGCTAIFGALGALSEASKPEATVFSDRQTPALEPGAVLRIVLNDGTRLLGKYSGTAHIALAEYEPLYSQARAHDRHVALLPVLGDTVMLRTRFALFTGFGKDLPGAFEGFAHDHIAMQLAGTGVLTSVPMSYVTQLVGANGAAFSGESLKQLLDEGRVPVRSALVLKSGEDKIRIAMNDIRQIEVPVKKNDARNGLLLGAAIDAVLIIAASQADWSLYSSGSLWGE